MKQDHSQIMENELLVTKGEKRCGEINQEFGINRYQLLCIKQIKQGPIAYSTANYIQDLVINSKGKESEKDLNHLAIHQKLTQHSKSTILQLKKKKSLFPLLLPEAQMEFSPIFIVRT